jgi:hypothetical protein
VCWPRLVWYVCWPRKVVLVGNSAQLNSHCVTSVPDNPGPHPLLGPRAAGGPHCSVQLAGRNRVLPAGACIAGTGAACGTSRTKEMSGASASACHSVCLTSRKMVHHTAHRLVLVSTRAEHLLQGPGHSHQGCSLGNPQPPTCRCAPRCHHVSCSRATTSSCSIVNCCPVRTPWHFERLPGSTTAKGLALLAANPTLLAMHHHSHSWAPASAQFHWHCVTAVTTTPEPPLEPHPPPPPHLLLVPPMSRRPARHTRYAGHSPARGHEPCASPCCH